MLSNPTATPTESILVIDDNADMLELQRLVLEDAGFAVITAQSGEEALNVLTSSPPPEPSLILLDMRMGKMSGQDFLLRLEERRPQIVDEVPVVFLTGQDVVPASRASGFIRKGRGMSEFLQDVRRYIDMGHQARLVH